jgi:adenine specific DNA methylase Mod
MTTANSMLRVPITGNHLFYGDNFAVLRDSIPDESVDLIYLDPPFNSQAAYNLLFRASAGEQSRAQVEAFEDTWHWGAEAEVAFQKVMASGNTDAAEMLRSVRQFLKENDIMAYLTMMAVRLLELHRVLKSSGTLYLHCDPTASHYLKILMDAIFGAAQFVNEISWRRTTAKADHAQGALSFPRLRDVILRYRKSSKQVPTYHQLFTAYGDAYLDSKYRYSDESGRKYRLDNLTGPGGAANGNPEYEVLGVTRFWRYSRKRMAELMELTSPH